MSAVPSTTWRMLSQTSPRKELPKGLDAGWDAAAGYLRRFARRQGHFLARAARILELEKDFLTLADPRLREIAQELAARYRRGRQTPEDLNRAFALIREVSLRQRGQKHFLVQVAGALALEAGCITEMATGEGKTLTATLAATVAGWRGKSCHLVTVNDYLAKRDAEEMAKLYNFLGLSVDYIDGEMPSQRRKQAYAADITYLTNKEVTADFLRDRLALGHIHDLPEALIAKITTGALRGPSQTVQRGLHYAIVDEADSILIDEAVTPLIISGNAPNPEQVEAFRQAVALAGQLEQGPHYRLLERYREVELQEAGKDRLEQIAQPLGGLWRGSRRREELAIQALTARHFYVRDKQYAVLDGEVIIIDEFTGRLMPGREWRDGLHQAVEAKEELKVNPPKETNARVSFQRFFRLYGHLAGMTGTAAEGWKEFWQIYHLPTVVIPTNRPCIRRKLPDRVLATDEAKWAAIVEEIERIHKTGRPILVGTRSVRASEHLSAMLTARGLEHQVLNAVRHEEEAQIVAEAGQKDKITVSTNMAGRGTDIKLGRGVADLGGLHVLATERHEAGRIDRQLFGRAGRQGDPGSAQAFVSLHDELTSRYTPTLAALLRNRTAGKGEVSSSVTRRLFDIAQGRAERMALRQRKGVLRTDDWLDEYLGFAIGE